MAKAKTVFYCTNCGNETPKWMGRCPSCGAYGLEVLEGDRMRVQAVELE